MKSGAEPDLSGQQKGAGVDFPASEARRGVFIVRQGLREGLGLVGRAKAFERGQTPGYAETNIRWLTEVATGLTLRFKVGFDAAPQPGTPITRLRELLL